MKENGLTLKRARSKQYSPETIIDAVYADDLVRTNKPGKPECFV